MDLFDKLRTAGPVDKKEFKRNDSEGKKKSSHDKDAENKHKRNSDHKHNSSSPDHKKKSSHDNIKKSSSQGKVEENHKKKHSASHGKGEESPSKKSYSSHGSHKEVSQTPSRKNSLQGHEKHKFDHRKKEESPSKHHKHDDTKKSKHGKDVNSTSKSNSNHVETPSKRKSNTEKDLETPSKKKATHDRDLDNKNKRTSSTEQSPIKKKLSNDKDSEKSNKKLSNHDKDTTATPRKSLDHKVAKFNDKHKTNKTDSSNQRRESLPSPVPPMLSKKKSADKSRSLSPPKSAPPSAIKPLKVKLERKKLEEFNTPLLKKREEEEPTKKKTPTKAQQKLFEPMGVKKTQKQILKEFNVKSCMVRIHRDNLKELMSEFKKNKLQPKLPKLILGTKRTAAPSPTGKNDGSPPLKKGKMGSPPKLKTSFFIKLATPKLDKMKSDKKSKHLSKHASKTLSSSSSSSSTSSAVAQHNKIKNSKSLATITPTKFSRSQLISTFGKHWFKSHVRIKRCNHPLMRTFESNARARRLQSKHNKSKNLSVSFRDQVEIFGGSSDSDDSYDENFSAVAPTPSRNGRRGSASNSATTPIVPATPIVMPARLKKVENGRVVDDILLDPSLFLDPQSLVASTPYSPGRKKRDHKSFSPLKDEGTPSPRKEQLKLANERVPPTGLRRLNIEEEDDEDDDCEYIVPIELPQRRASRTSSTNTVEGGGPAIVPPTFDDDDVLPYSTSAIFNEIDEAITIAKGLVSPATVSSTNTDSNATTKDAVDADAPAVATVTTNNVKEAATNSNNVSDNTESHESFQSANQNPDRPISSSPSMDLGDAFNHVVDNAPQIGNTTALNGNVNSTLAGDLSVNDINLFIEDSQTNEDSPEKNYVDSLINETIDKLGRDMDSPASDENYRNAI